MTGTKTPSLMHLIRRLAGAPSSEVSDGELVERFLTQDERAFEMLIERHGSMVWGVCRRVLGNCADADDAYQATFLVLAKSAGNIRKLPSVGSWLHGVALRIAQKARVSAARRRRRETEAAGTHVQEAEDSLTLGEVKQILDEELHGLPEQYKTPLVLCCLEGKSRDEAAAELGWSVGSLKGRLERARELLGQRLARRGLTLSATLIAMTLLEGSRASAAPVHLSAATIGACVPFAAGQTVALSGQTVALARSFLSGTVIARLRPLALGLVLMLTAGFAAYPHVATNTDVEKAPAPLALPMIEAPAPRLAPAPEAPRPAPAAVEEPAPPAVVAPPIEEMRIVAGPQKEPEPPPQKIEPKKKNDRPGRLIGRSVAATAASINAALSGQARPMAIDPSKKN